MKKLLTLALAVLMCVFAISALADTVSIDRTLELQFVPSKDADVIITGTKNLPELLKAALLEQGYDVKDINITVGTNYEATGEAMAAGTVDLGWLPGGTYALFSDDVDVILTATRAGLSNDSEDPTTYLERRGQQDPEERPAGHLLPLPDLRHAFRLRQGAGCQGQRGRSAHVG